MKIVLRAPEILWFDDLPERFVADLRECVQIGRSTRVLADYGPDALEWADSTMWAWSYDEV